MYILLLGSKGQVGSAILKHAPADWKITAWSRTDVDFADTTAVRKKLNEYGREHGAPDVIINAAAYTKVDLAESQPVDATKLNVDLALALAEAARVWKSKLVHYSTDYVYPGTGSEPYYETDEVGPLSIYGKTKLMGDLAIQESGCEYLIFRTSWVYASEGKNFLLTMLRLASEREVLKVVSDQIGSPTLADDIATITIKATSAAADLKEFPSGIYHLTNSGYTSWHGFTEAILAEAKRAGLPVVTRRVEAIPTSEYPTPAQRPLNSRLSLNKLHEVFGITPRSWTEALHEVILSIHK